MYQIKPITYNEIVNIKTKDVDDVIRIVASNEYKS